MACRWRRAPRWAPGGPSIDKRLPLALVALLVAAPLAFAHSPAGTPKNYCEDPSSGDWSVHDYAGLEDDRVPPVSSQDGNLAGDCAPGFSVTPTYACPSHHWLIGVNELGTYVCVDPPATDWDRHNEFALGGAVLLVASGEGVPSTDPAVGAGTLYCFGAEGHHANYVIVTVEDVVLGAGADYHVTSDTVDVTGAGEGCGDLVSDNHQHCSDTCTVTFPHGLDGSYQVYVRLGTAGHLRTN